MFQRKRIFVVISCVCRGLAWMIIRMFEIPSWPIQRSTSAVSAETCANAMDAQTVFGSLSSSPSEYCSHCPMKNTLRPTITNTFLELNTGKSKIKCQPRTTSVHTNFVPSLKLTFWKKDWPLGSFYCHFKWFRYDPSSMWRLNKSFFISRLQNQKSKLPITCQQRHSQIWADTGSEDEPSTLPNMDQHAMPRRRVSHLWCKESHFAPGATTRSASEPEEHFDREPTRCQIHVAFECWFQYGKWLN